MRAKDHSFLFQLRVGIFMDEPLIIINAWEGGVNFNGGTRIDVEVKQGGNVIFRRGDTWCGTPAYGGMSLDGKEAKELVLSLVAMKPGDTDAEYFENYTNEQIEWAEKYGDYLCSVGMERYSKENNE